MKLHDVLKRRSPWAVVTLEEREQPSRFWSVKQAEDAMREAGILPPYDWSYAKDHHFARWIYESLTDRAKVDEFLAQLDKDNTEQTTPPFRWGCTKAKQIRQYLAKPFWTASMDRVKAAIAPARRVCCSCHETGSFCRIDQVKKR